MSTPQDEFGLVLKPELSIEQRAMRAMKLFGWGYVLPATSDGKGHHRTAYFYRQVAIRFAQDARHPMTRVLCRGDVSVFVSLAKSYLASYRKMKGCAR